MPANPTESQHYIARHDLLEIDCHTNVVDVCRELAGREHSGVIVCEDGSPARYVNGRELAGAYLEATRVDRSVLDLDLRTFLAWDERAVLHVKVSPTFADAGEMLDLLAQFGTEQSDRIVYPITDEGELIGYLFSDEDLKQKADTEPPKYICQGPDRHVNRDPDSGTCYYCPHPIGAPT